MASVWHADQRISFLNGRFISVSTPFLRTRVPVNVTHYCSAIVTMLAVMPPNVSTTGTASPTGAFCGICTFT
jgi:hypothetical protein